MALEFDLGLAVFSEIKNKALQIAVELLGSGKQSGRAFDSIQPLGLIARPRDPDVGSDGRPGKGASALYCWDGGDAYCMPLSDPRFLSKVPPVKKGGVALYSAPGGILSFDGVNGALVILVPADEKGTKNHALSIDPAAKSIQLRHAAGMGLSITEGGKNSVILFNKAGDAYIEINDEGITINGNLTVNGGIVGGNPEGGVAVALSTELTTVVAALQAGLPVAAGVAKLATPIPTPGSSTVSVSP